MKNTLLTLTLLLLPLLGNAQNILGYWYLADKSAIVEVYQKEKTVSARVAWIEHPYDANGQLLTDTNNKDKAMKGRPLLGMPLIEGMTQEKGCWDNGTVYDPDTGRSYDCIIKLVKGKLHVRGHVGPFGKTLIWTRAGDKLPEAK